MSANPITWDEAIRSIQSLQRMQGFSERTIHDYGLRMRHVERTTGKLPNEITKTDLRELLWNPKWAPSTRQTTRAVYQVMFRFLFDDELIDQNPAKTLEKIKVPRREARPFTPTQVEALLSSGAYARTRTMILLGAMQGMRAGEIARFRGEMIDMTENTITYVSKGGVERHDQMHPLVREQAWKYPRRGYWFPSRGTNDNGHIHPRSVSDLMSRAIRRAGIESHRLTGHSLRHFFGSQLIEAGTDIRVIQHMMGHASLATTALYTQVSRSKEVNAIATLPMLEVPTHTPRRGSKEASVNR
jgi:integrase/recombinase XerD